MNNHTLADCMIIDSENVSNTIVNFIRLKVAENGKDGVCLGISGGLDSTVVATLSVKAMKDPHRVYGLHLYSRTSQRKFREHAQKLADELGINFEIRDISKLLEEKGAYKSLVVRAISFSSILNRFSFKLAKAILPLFSERNAISTTFGNGNQSPNTLITMAKTVEAFNIIRGIEMRRIILTNHEIQG